MVIQGCTRTIPVLTYVGELEDTAEHGPSCCYYVLPLVGGYIGSDVQDKGLTMLKGYEFIYNYSTLLN